MGMSNINLDNVPIGEIIAAHIDTNKLNEMISARISVLAEQLNEEASQQLVQDGSKIHTVVEGEMQNVGAHNELKESYLISYLQSHSVPVAGGDAGTVHNVDGSTYHSRVPMKFWGNELSSLMLPIIDVFEEADNYLNIIFPDAVEEAKPKAMPEITEAVKPEIMNYVKEQLASSLGGVSS